LREERQRGRLARRQRGVSLQRHSWQSLSGDAAREAGIPEHAAQLLETTDRDAVDEFLHLPKYIDVAIPRGGAALITRVTQEARMPVIKHFAGNCHVYVDQFADLDVAEKVLVNSKCQRLGPATPPNRSSFMQISRAKQFLGSLKRWPTKAWRFAATSLARPLPGSQRRSCDRRRPLRRISRVDYLCKGRRLHRSGDRAYQRAQLRPHRSDYFARRRRDQEVHDRNRQRRRYNQLEHAAPRRRDSSGSAPKSASAPISSTSRGPCGVNELTSYKYVVYGDGAVRE
jgi:glutamate-5-semialdehyde dehydrogenase